MDYSNKIKTWQEFVSEASKDADGPMNAEVRICLKIVGPEALGENVMAIYAKAWKEYQR